MFNKTMRVVAGSMVAVLLSTLALALDRKIYPGSMAITTSGPSPTYSTSAIGNPSSSSWLYVNLPIVNDTYTEIESSWVRVLDRHYISAVRCKVNSAYWNNTHETFYGSWGADQYSTGSSNQVQVLNTGEATGGSTRHYYMSCAIPPTYSGNRSYIVSYQAGE